jgi:hypothetical protein
VFYSFAWLLYKLKSFVEKKYHNNH